MERLARDAAEGGTRIVAALGGDGTASLAANGLLGTGAALAAFPAGTGDDFAKAIGAGKLDAAIALLADPKTADLDVIEVTTGAARRSFINIAGAGFDSEVNETANGMTVKLGATGTYLVALLKTLSSYSPAAFTIQVDDERMELNAMLVEVGSGRWTGGGMKVLPDAVMNDGMLDVCVVEALSKTRVPASVPARVPRLAHHAPEGPDAHGHAGPGRGEPARARVRRRRVGRLAAGDLRDASGRPSRRGRSGRQERTVSR